MRNGKIVNTLTPEELLRKQRSGKKLGKNEKMNFSKKLKNLNKSSSVATRFVDTVHIANRDMCQADRTIELMPILRDNKLKQKTKRPLPTSHWKKSKTYVAPLDREIY